MATGPNHVRGPTCTVRAPYSAGPHNNAPLGLAWPMSDELAHGASDEHMKHQAPTGQVHEDHLALKGDGDVTSHP
jgi:hypothetical protein